MKKFSHKDLVVALGIIVALVILLVATHFKEPALVNQSNSGNSVPQKKIQPIVVIKRIVEKVTSKVMM